MTLRMTVGVSILTIGLAIAALAGIPWIAENRILGNTLMIAGFVVALIGGVVGAAAVRGQRAANARLRENRKIDIEQLQLERRDLNLQRTELQARIRSARSKPLEPASMRELIRLGVELSTVETSLARNSNEFRRLGEAPGEPA